VTEVVVYTREGCHLCEEAIEKVVALHSEEGRQFTLREVDIESDERLLREMLERIPVVEVDGALVSELILDADVLRARLDTVAGDR
jgi:glutaredoxin